MARNAPARLAASSRTVTSRPRRPTSTAPSPVSSRTARLATMGIRTQPDREIVALIAYLQRLGRDGKAALQNQQASAP